ncbi:hypothetical protein BROUX41_003132 [Berkeleyomyces rouxiae]|uniref:uncharacterized protein n=1 Tax=Berkeleyomyces rouxiae TaxID=2035830 RepID=UPI003B77CC0F
MAQPPKTKTTATATSILPTRIFSSQSPYRPFATNRKLSSKISGSTSTAAFSGSTAHKGPPFTFGYTDMDNASSTKASSDGNNYRFRFDGVNVKNSTTACANGNAVFGTSNDSGNSQRPCSTNDLHTSEESDDTATSTMDTPKSSRVDFGPATPVKEKTAGCKAAEALTAQDVMRLDDLVVIHQKLNDFDSYVDWQHTLKMITTLCCCTFADMDEYCPPLIQMSLLKFIRKTCEPSLLDEIRLCLRPGEAVEKLRHAVIGDAETARCTFMKQLQAFEYDEGETLGELVDRYMAFVNRAPIFGVDISDEEKATQISKLVSDCHDTLRPILALLNVITPKEEYLPKLQKFLRLVELPEKPATHRHRKG